MALPPILLFETHADPTAKRVAYELLPKLKKVGYKVLCVEMPHNFTSEEIIEHVKIGVAQSEESQSVIKKVASMMGISESALSQKTEIGINELLMKFLPAPSDQEDHSSNIANRFCRLEAEKEMLKILNLAKQHGFLIKGIDSEPKVLEKRKPVKDLRSAKLIDVVREQTMSGHIESLRQKGVIYICGALHAASLISKCKDTHYFYPRSTKWQPIEDEENKKCGYTETDFLKDPSQVLSERDIPSFADRIVTHITTGRYLKEYPEGNSQSKHLAKVFNAVFKVFMRSGFYADALVERATTPNIADIEIKLKASNIETGTASLNGKEYLVIPNINEKAVADRIMSLQSVSLPPILLFEAHTDPTGKQVAHELLPKLKKVGYEVLCVELSQDLNSAQIIEYVKEMVEECEVSQSIVKMCAEMMEISESALSQKTALGVAKLLKRCLPVQQHPEFNHMSTAIRFRRLEADKEMLQLLNLAQRCGFIIKGIDREIEFLKKYNYTKDPELVKLLHEDRERTMSGNIESLRQRGVIYICGALHAASLIRKCDDIHYFYPRSKKWQPIEDEEDKIIGNNENDFLKDPSQVLSQGDIPSFADRIVTQITRREFPEGNPQSNHLAKVFKAIFKVFLRPGSYAEALVERATTPNIADIEAKLKASNIKTGIDSMKGKEYLVIPNINVKDVADRIMSL